MDRILCLPALAILIPVTVVLTPLIKLTSPGPVFFVHKRSGKAGKAFRMIKFRTMHVGAESQRGNPKLEKLNMADGPVFKIKDDPRLTRIGRFLFKSGLDELPQVINVLRGEMSFVGPRPFPVYEAKNLTKSQRIRERVLPGITSSWVISGSHNLRFRDWMKLDKEYVAKADLVTDIIIIYKTAILMFRIGLRKTVNTLTRSQS